MAELTIDVNVRFDDTIPLALENWCWRNKIKPGEKDKLLEILGRMIIVEDVKKPLPTKSET